MSTPPVKPANPGHWPEHVRHAVALATKFGTALFMGVKL